MATSTLGSGTLVLAGTTSGTTTVTATAVAGTTTLTLPAATDTLVGRATTDTLTNKTLTGAAMNGTVGATTPSTGAFTTLNATSTLASATAIVNTTNANGTFLQIQLSGTPKTYLGSSVAISGTGTSSDTDIYATGSLRLFGGDQVTKFATLSSAGLAVTGLTDISAASSGQIKFPATQNASADANTLDDYEEGTWTPSVGGTATYGAQTGYYVKVGKIVYVKGTIITTLIGTGSTNTISGLPFTCRVTTPLSVAYFDTINTAATFLGIRISQANTTMLLVGTTAAQATITDSFSTFKNGTYLEFAGVYEVA